ITTVVVDTTSSLLGQVTCFISTRTSCRNSRASATVPETRWPMPAAAPVIALLPDSSFFTFTDCVAIKPLHFPEQACSPFRPSRFPPLLVKRLSDCALAGRQTLAGEEGFEPPYPVLETGVLAVGRLPFTPSPRSGTRGLPRSESQAFLGLPPSHQ